MSEKRINIAYVYTIYNETGDRLDLLLKALAVTQTVPCVYYILFDRATSIELLDTIVQHFPGKFIYRLRTTIPKKFIHQACERGFVELYNCLETEYVCWNHSDDIPEPNRAEVQLRSLEKYPQAAVSLAGFYRVKKGYEINKESFHVSPNYGFNVGYPSGWMLNKKVLPKLEVSWEYMKRFKAHWDAVTLLNLLMKYPLVKCELPLFYYNDHGSDPALDMKAENQKYYAHWLLYQRVMGTVYSYPSGWQLNLGQLVLKQENERALYKEWYTMEYSETKPHLTYAEWKMKRSDLNVLKK